MMIKLFKIVFILAFIPASSLACLNKLSPTDVKRVIDNGSYQVAESFTYAGADGVCVDGINLLDYDLVDGKLSFNSDKKFSRELSEKNAADAEKAKLDKRKSFEFKGKTIAELRTELNEYLQLMKE